MEPHAETIVRGIVGNDGRLAVADNALADLHLRAGGEPGGVLAVPQMAAIARLSRRLGIAVSRPIIAADGDSDLDLWVRAAPMGQDVALEISGWAARPARQPLEALAYERDADFLRTAADWMWETDSSLRLTALSQLAAEAVGGTSADFLGGQLTRLFKLEEDGDDALPLLEALAEGRRFERQAARLRGDEQNRRLMLAGVPLIDGVGRFAGFRGSVVLAASGEAGPGPASRHSPALGERLDAALRRPLDAIVRSADAMAAQADGPLSEDYVGYAADIASAGRHLIALVGDLADLAAVERPDFAPDMETVDLADVARRAAGLLAVRAADRNVSIDGPANDESVPVSGDFRRLLQIMVNLIGNAIRHTPEGGMVWIRPERRERGGAAIVADQGDGVAASEHERIFEKFVRLEPERSPGSGLGLYISRRLARAMGGDISLDSAPGQGARFTLSIPAAG